MAEYRRAAAADEIAEGAGKTVFIDGKPIALFHLGGEFFALDDVCPHRGGSLGHGTLEGEMVECPLHGWTFSVKTGRMAMSEGVRAYPVRVERGDVFVEL
jgi:nitrite reductase/ring-hydroxylating ferredoxin subunit